jgi:ribosomal protein S18 acetylase RimI-like enzyme
MMQDETNRQGNTWPEEREKASPAGPRRIIPLREGDTPPIVPVINSYFPTQRALADYLARSPHLAWRVEGTSAYILGSHWKGRREIGWLLEATPGPDRPYLVDHLLGIYRQQSTALVIIGDREMRRGGQFYHGLGVTELEHVVVYERPLAPPPSIPQRLTILPLRHPDELTHLVDLEQATFPWLWWETADTFGRIAAQGEGEVRLAWLGHDLVGYLIVAAQRDYGHIHRIAVHPRWQGHGYGAELLAWAINHLQGKGARVVGLNTQTTNVISQRLYQGFGFRRTGESFRIYGLWLDHRYKSLYAKEDTTTGP